MVNKKNRKLFFGLIIIFILFLNFNLVYAGRQSVISKANDFRIDLVSYDPSPMVPGKEATLKFEITNLGSNPIEGLQIGFVDKYPFIVSNQFIKIDYLEYGKSRQFEFNVKTQDASPAGNYTSSLQFYSPSLGSFNSEVFSLTVKNPSQVISLANVKTEPEVVAPGQNVKVSIFITNTYSSTLRDISVRLDVVNASNFVPSGTTAENNIKQLRAGEGAEVSFDLAVSPNAQADVYRIPVILTYTDESGIATTKSTYLGVKVNQEPVYSVYLEDLTAYEKEKAGKAVISISNVGPVDIKYLNVRLLESEAYEPITKSQVYIGNLKADDYQTAEFQIYRKTEGKLKLFLEYKDSFGNEYSKVVDVDMPLFDNKQATKYGLTTPSSALGSIFIVIFLILIVWTGIEWYKHRSFKSAVSYVFFGVIILVVDFFRFFRPGSIKKRFKEVKEHLKKEKEEK